MIDTDIKKQSVSNFVVGQKDEAGNLIEDIYSKNPDFIIYKSAGRVSTFLNEDHLPEKEKIYTRRYIHIDPKVAKCFELIDNRTAKLETVQRHMARAIALALREKYDESNEVMDDLIRRLENLRLLHARFQYQIGAIVSTFALILVFILLLTLNLYYPESKFVQFGERIFGVLSFSALGGYLSIAIGIKQLQIETESGVRMNGFAGANRIFIAICASIFSFSAIEANIILGSYSNLEFGPSSEIRNDYLFYTVAFLTGFSERLIPNILRKIDKDN